MQHKKVKIIATLGPASDTKVTIKRLAVEGVDIFRINLSHARHDEVIRIIKEIRTIEKEIQTPLSILGDLAGPKIRIGEVEEGTTLNNGETIDIVKNEVVETPHTISINYPSILSQLSVGAAVYIDDGRIQLEVSELNDKGIKAKVIVGGLLKSHKGFYAEGLSLDFDGLSEKDSKDLQLLVKQGVDALAVSFVQSEKDILSVRDSLPDGSPIMIVAKIETAKAIENIDKIIKVSDAIMIARGDLGLAVPIAEVPHLQKRLITLCLAAAKPVITATQMLESMHTNPIPTRAEVTDVANAILDGTDAVMLSGETASGQFPVETVRTMVKIILSAIPHLVSRSYNDEHTISGAISSSIGEVADQVGAKLVVAFTQNGNTAKRISRHRHHQTIFALSPVDATLRRLNFSWGVLPVRIKPTEDLNDMRKQALNIAKSNAFVPLEKEDPFVIAAGMPFGMSGSTNLILVEKV